MADQRTPLAGATQQELEEVMVAHRVKLREPKMQERLLAEFVGTFFLVLTIGTAAQSSEAKLAAIAIGLMLAVQIYVFGSISGALFNPAVTFAVVLSRRGKLEPLHGLLYMGAQIAAGIVGAVLAFAGAGTTFCFDNEALDRGWGTSLEYELFFTTALCLVVLAAGTSNDAPNQYFGFAIGCAVIAGALACGGFDQGSFNPAVTVGINFANYLNSHSAMNPSFGAWLIFLFGPMFGGALAAGIFRFSRGNEYESYDQENQVSTATD